SVVAKPSPCRMWAAAALSLAPMMMPKYCVPVMQSSPISSVSMQHGSTSLGSQFAPPPFASGPPMLWQICPEPDPEPDPDPEPLPSPLPPAIPVEGMNETYPNRANAARTTNNL